MTIEQAVEYWTQKYNAAINFYDEHWDAEERREHQTYIEAIAKALYALEPLKKNKRIFVEWLKNGGGEVE